MTSHATTRESHLRPSGFLLVATLLLTSCAAGVAYEAPPPDLVYVSPGVQVIADYNEPIFYSDNLYWRYDGGVWYRSHHYRGGWAVATPPPAVLRIDRPRAYTHYRPAGWTAHRAPPPARFGRTAYAPPPPRAAPVRGYQPPAVQSRPAPRPMAPPPRGGGPFRMRDHRDMRR